MNDKHREIKSFVQRPGRLTPAQRSALTDLAPRYVIPFEPAPCDASDWFGRKAPLLMEIGFGNGDSLVELANLMPDWNVLGIEVHEPGVGHCLLMADKHELAHFRIIRHDAIEVMREQLRAASVTRLNLYFPDPWPKKRHHKRRILAPKFLDLAMRVLCDDGTLHIATDWAPYAEHIDEVMAAEERWACLQRVHHDGSQPLERPGTKFERRGLNLGHSIVDWKFARRD